MKEIKLKTIEVVEAYKLLGEPSFEGVDDLSKVKVWRISRKLSPIAQHYQEEKTAAFKQFMPSDEEFTKKINKASDFELIKVGKKKGELPITEEEYNEIAAEYIKYMELISKALKEEENKEVTLEIEPISDEALGSLMTANKWSLQQVDKIGFIVE